MGTRRLDVLFLGLSPLLVLGSSFFGLLRWVRSFDDVWAASLVGDAVFVVGTIGAIYAAIEVGRHKHPLAGAAAAIVLNWVVYGLAWSITGPAMFDPETHRTPDPSDYRWPGLWWYVIEQGFQGLLFCGAVVSAWARWMPSPAKPR